MPRGAYDRSRFETGSPGALKVRRHYRRHKLRVNAKTVQKNRNRRAVVGSASLEQVNARASMFGFRCYMCGGPWETVDHVIPLARGGTGWPANLRPACNRCNARKGAGEWRKYIA